MKQIKVILNVSEEGILAESGQSNLDDAIASELGWLRDSGMFVEKWEYHDWEKDRSAPHDLSALTQEEKLKIYEEVELARRREIIYDNLKVVCETMGRKENAPKAATIMTNGSFMKAVLDYWDGEVADRSLSVINMKIRDYMQGLLAHDFPDLFPSETEVTLKVPSETVDMVNDILGKTQVEISDLFGAMDDDLEFRVDFGNNISGMITLSLPDDAEGKACLRMNLFRFGENIAKPLVLKDASQLNNTFQITSENGKTYTMTIESAEELRRVGNSYIYQATDPEYANLNGEICTVLRRLEPKIKCYPLCVGPIYEVKFQDGDIMCVYDEELTEPEKARDSLNRSPSLNEMLDKAKTKAPKSKQNTPAPER